MGVAEVKATCRGRGVWEGLTHPTPTRVRKLRSLQDGTVSVGDSVRGEPGSSPGTQQVLTNAIPSRLLPPHPPLLEAVNSGKLASSLALGEWQCGPLTRLEDNLLQDQEEAQREGVRGTVR